MGAFHVPEGPRGVLCHPPLSEWSAMATANQAVADAWRFDVQGVSATRLRADARRRVLNLAGLGGTGDEDRRPLFVTGHQPELYHPGVWLKAFAVKEAARAAGGFGINWIVDHDAGGLAAEIPRRTGGTRQARRAAGAGFGSDGAGRGGVGIVETAPGRVEEAPGRAEEVPGHFEEALGHVAEAALAAERGLGAKTAGAELQVRVHRLLSPQSGRPFETLSPPSAEQVAAFVRAVDEDVATLGLAKERELWRTYAAGLARLIREGVPHAAEAGWRGRAEYERTLGSEPIPDVPWSRVAATPEFLLFFVHWAVHARDFLAAYNRALERYREARGVRSRANPFPDLVLRPDGAVELPFWGLTDAGIRRKLYVRSDAGQLILTHLEGDFAKIPAAGGFDAVEALLEAGVQVRPRAVPLTIFTRLFVADVFVHGTGGARYDEVTDMLMADVFGVQPPPFGVVSATVHLPLGFPAIQASALSALKHKLRDLRFNPQRYAWEAVGVDTALDERFGPLLREKERLIDEIRRTPKGVPAPESASGQGASAKRVLTRAIERTNAELYGLLGAVERETLERLAHWESKARSATAAARRTYPFFLYDPADMRKLLRNGGA